MKIISIGMTFFLITTHCWGQVLNGKIHEGLSESGVENVRLRVQGYTDSKTDDFGLFSIRLPGAARGSLVNINIQKEGYAVINREAIKPRVPANDQENLKIYICPVSKRNELAAQHYKIHVNQTITRNFNQEAKILADNMNYEAIGELTRKKEIAEKMADSLAAKLARFDPQKASEEHTKAMQLYKEGKVDAALEMIDADHIVARIINQKNAIKQDLDALLRAAEIALTNFQFNKAQNYYEKAVEADTTNFGIIWDCASFLFLQGKSDKLISYAKLMIRNSKGDYEKSIGLGYLGLALNDQNKSEEAIKVYQEALLIKQKLSQQNPDLHEADLAVTLNNVGLAYSDLNRYKEAISSYKESLEIRRRLSQDHPDRFEPDLAMTMNNLSLCYANLGQYEDAVSSYDKALGIMRPFSRSNPELFEPDLAMILNNLGLAYMNLNAYRQADSVYKETLEIFRRLSQQNPDRFLADVASTLNNQGIARRILKYPNDAISLFTEALELRRKLSKKNPDRFLADVANTLNNLGAVYYDLKRYEDAIKFNKEALEIRRGLFKDNPSQFGGELTMSLNNLKIIYSVLKLNEESYHVYKEALAVYERLYQVNPDRFHDYYVSACYNLSWRALFVHAFAEAEESARKTLELSPSSTGVISNLASALLFQGKIKEAKSYYQNWKDKPWGDDRYKTYGEAFLSDLKELEESGITHPDVEKLRKLLKKNE